ncbi:hypothetical protein AB0M05_07920 [Streptomyces violaceusniger]
MPTGADGVRSARIVEAVLTSSASLTWTDVDPTAIALEATA